MKTQYFFFTVMIFLVLTSITFSQNQEKFIYKDNMRINAKTNVAVAIYNIDSRQYSGTPQEIARQYLIENKILLGFKDNLDDLKILQVKESPAGRHVGFEQYYKGVPVMRSEMVVSINRQNRISMVVNGYKPNISVNINPSIGKDHALLLSKQAIGAMNSKEIIPPKTELVVYEDSVSTFHLAWKILMYPSEPEDGYLVLIDAHDGKTLEILSTIIDFVSGIGRVFNPDPSTELRNSALTDQNDADYSELQPAYDTVAVNDLNDAAGGVYKVQGKYASSMNITAPNDPIVTETNPANFKYNRSQNGFEEVNIYYFIDKFRRYIGNLGFSPTWGYLGSNSQTIAFDARGRTDRNASYDQFSEYMRFGVPISYVDAGEDQSVILHEYGHALHDALMFGGIDNAAYESDTRGISEGISDYLGIGYRRTIQVNPYRPNYRSNWFYPDAGESILPSASAKYPTPKDGGHWGTSPYAKMNVWASTLMDIEYNTATNPSAGIKLGRNVTTKLMLASLSYVTSNSNVLDNVNAILQADRDIYGGAHLSTLASVFYNRGFFYYDQVSGTISSNTTWSMNKYITGNVTVNSGVTLTISPNTFVFFANGASLTVNGTLNANGTSSNRITFTSASGTTPGSWGSIVISGIGADCSSIKFANIEYGTEIQVNNNAIYVDITDCNISNLSSNAIRYSGASHGRVLRNVINSTNIYHGVVVESGSYVQCDQNTIIKSGTNQYRGVGILFGGGGDGTVWQNDIQGWSWGMGAIWGSSPEFRTYNWSAHTKSNRITNNYHGVHAYQSGYPTIGEPATGWGYNSIYSNTKNIYYTSGGTLYAWTTYWGEGGPNPSTMFVLGPGCSVNTSNWLANDPWGIGGGGGQQSLVFNGTGKRPTALYENNLSETIQMLEVENSANSNGESDNIFSGIKLRGEQGKRIAKDFFKSYIAKNPEDQRAYVELYKCYDEETADEITKYFESLPKSAAKEFGLLLSYLYLKQGKIEQAKATNNRIIVENKNTELAVKAKLDNFYIALYNENDPITASKLLKEVLSNPKLSTQIELDLAQSALKTYVDPKAGNMPYFHSEQKEVESIAIENVQDGLLSNYPNPFNPTTVVSYQLSVVSRVNLKVYDMLGREVVTLADGMKEAGYYTATFDGSGLASGIYFARLTATPQEGTPEGASKPFVAVKKLLMMK